MLTYNTPDVTGFSICWNGYIEYMHAHVPGEDFAFYQGYDKAIWLHFPLDKGETISEIWKQGRWKRGSVLMVSTLISVPDLNKSTTDLFKAQNKLRSHHCSWSAT